MIMSIGQVAGAVALFAGLFLAFGLPVALIAGGASAFVGFTLGEFISTPRARPARVRGADGAIGRGV